MFRIALGLYAITAASALAMIVVVSYHFLTYRVQGDRSPQVLTAFLIGSGILLAGLTASFFGVPWDEFPLIIQKLR